jgi:iron(III) transport system substrate-binding protein
MVQDRTVNDRFDYPSARALCGLLLILLALGAPLRAAELNVYSARKEALIKPLLDKYSAASGVTVNLVTGKGDALLTRLQTEGRNSPADVLITTDAGRLYRAHEAGVLQKIASPALDAAIPAHLRSEQGDWYGLSVRARAIVYARDRVQPGDLSSYEDLADPKWKRRICIRSSSNIYNQSLVASMLAAHGGEKTDAWLRGLVANFARPPQGGDRDQITAVAAGQCDIAVVNSYYFGAMLQADDAQRTAAEKVAIFWPNQDGRGTHINVSGAGVTAWARNAKAAVGLIEFLAGDESQRWYAEANNEYPVRADIPVSELLQSWGEFRTDPLDVTELGKRNAAAVMAMDRAGWK